MSTLSFIKRYWQEDCNVVARAIQHFGSDTLEFLMLTDNKNGQLAEGFAGKID